MKAIQRSVRDGRIYIITETDKWFGLVKKQRTFSSGRQIVGDFYRWVEEPDKTIVPDSLSFQLDEWNRFLKELASTL
jgi:hypothetical protein